jgi:glycosyltransferase involved in cell wall biosynthesis
MNSLNKFQDPEISVLMTAFNSEAYLAEAIESILVQETERTWELLFVDDGSTDKTLAIAMHYALNFPDKIHVYRHAGGENLGISASRNLALSHARGSMITFLDSDDVWLPIHLETQASLLNRMPQVSMVYGGAERWVDFHLPFDESASRAADWGSNYLPPIVPAGESTGLLQRGSLLQWFQEDESMVPCICTVMVRTATARAVGGFCEGFRGLYDDQVFHAKVSRDHEIYANDICVARYRQHTESCCATARSNAELVQREFDRFLCFLLQA